MRHDCCIVYGNGHFCSEAIVSMLVTNFGSGYYTYSICIATEGFNCGFVQTLLCLVVMFAIYSELVRNYASGTGGLNMVYIYVD
jgi:hypothetical protein